MLYKATKFKTKDIDTARRTAVLAFATYNTEDRDKDIARKGMFTKSWSESFDDIRYFKNHNKDIPIGTIDRFEEDDTHAYAIVKMGDWTDADDMLKMMAAGAATNNSYGFDPVKSINRKDKGKERGREFLEAKLWEISTLTHWGSHPASKVVEVKKEESEMKMEIKELKESIDNMESFCRNTSASDETIIEVLKELEKMQQLLLKYDGTAATQEGDDQLEPDARGNNDDEPSEEQKFAESLTLLTLKI
jgi:HK97 family phage prohead protease